MAHGNHGIDGGIGQAVAFPVGPNRRQNDLYLRVRLKDGINEKQFLDDLRVRNGNLEIMLLRAEENEREL